MMRFFGLTSSGAMGVACTMVVGIGASPAWGQCAPVSSGLVSWWDADSVSGPTVFDIQDANDGILVNGATTAPGKVGQAFSFDGVDDGLVIPDSPSFDVTDYTLVAWIKTADAGSGRRRIVSQQNPDPNVFWVLSLFNNQLEVCSKTSSQVLDLATQCERFIGQNLADGQFHHVAITRKNATAIKWYIDGANVRTDTITNNGSFEIQGDVFIGRLDPIVEDFFSVNESFNGLIDEVEFYNRELSASEIAAIFSAGSAGKCKDADGDGVNDADDACPSSDLSATIVIDGDDTGVDNELVGDGCSLADLIAEVLTEDATTADIVQLLVELRAAGSLSGREMGAILRSVNRP